MIKQLKIDNLEIEVYASRKEMGKAAAKYFSQELEAVEKKTTRMVFAAAPSQQDFIDAAIADKSIKWEKIEAFHMDEYIGIPSSQKESFANWLGNAVFNRLPFPRVECLDGIATIAEAECERYASLLQEAPIDIVALGIGENGHIAFNDPPVADFNDVHTVKTVEIDEKCRQQQVNDGCFPNMDAVPRTAYTLTVPTLMSGKSLICIVPGKQKAQAIYDTLYGEISTECPASILRQHKRCKLFLDTDSASMIL